MTSKPTLKEAKADLAQTIRDIKYLKAIVTNLQSFLNNDEGREHLRFDQLRYETHLHTAEVLKIKIDKVINSYESH